MNFIKVLRNLPANRGGDLELISKDFKSFLNTRKRANKFGFQSDMNMKLKERM
jgi:hypothetical protein